jgi:hypothetical protein
MKRMKTGIDNRHSATSDRRLPRLRLQQPEALGFLWRIDNQRPFTPLNLFVVVDEVNEGGEAFSGACSARRISVSGQEPVSGFPTGSLDR